MSYYIYHIKKILHHEYTQVKLQELISFRIWNSTENKFKIDELSFIPTMLTPEEKKMLVWLTQFYYTGEGEIVDLGSFLGGSTIHLSHGLSKNKLDVKEKRVHAYDRFKLDKHHIEKWLTKNKINYTSSDVFPLVKEMLKDYNKYINFNQGDFTNSNSFQKPIEILFIDISKTWELSDVIVKNFFSQLIPGKSIVIQQDMLYVNCPWVHAVMFRLKDYFKLISYTEQNSVIFLNTAKIGKEAVNWVLQEKFTYRDIINSLDHYIDAIPYFKAQEMLQECKNRVIKNPKATKSWEL